MKTRDALLDIVRQIAALASSWESVAEGGEAADIGLNIADNLRGICMTASHGKRYFLIDDDELASAEAEAEAAKAETDRRWLELSSGALKLEAYVDETAKMQPKAPSRKRKPAMAGLVLQLFGAPKKPRKVSDEHPTRGPGLTGPQPDGRGNRTGIKHDRKLNDVSAGEVKWLCAHTKLRNRALAARYDVSRETISHTRHGRRHGGVTPKKPTDG